MRDRADCHVLLFRVLFCILLFSGMCLDLKYSIDSMISITEEYNLHFPISRSINGMIYGMRASFYLFHIFLYIYTYMFINIYIYVYTYTYKSSKIVSYSLENDVTSQLLKIARSHR
jgi:hypothetical protein